MPTCHVRSTPPPPPTHIHQHHLTPTHQHNLPPPPLTSTHDHPHPHPTPSQAHQATTTTTLTTTTLQHHSPLPKCLYQMYIYIALWIISHISVYMLVSIIWRNVFSFRPNFKGSNLGFWDLRHEPVTQNVSIAPACQNQFLYEQFVLLH